MNGTVVLGLGNLVHSDDGVGVHAIRAMELDPRVPAGVSLVDGGTQGLSLLPHLSGAERLIVIDAVDTGEKPGTVMRFEGKALRGIPGKASVHQLGFADLMIASELIGGMPPEMIVIGVQPESTEWGVDLTPAVQAALQPMVKVVLQQLEIWQECSV